MQAMGCALGNGIEGSAGAIVAVCAVAIGAIGATGATGATGAIGATGATGACWPIGSIVVTLDTALNARRSKLLNEPSSAAPAGGSAIRRRSKEHLILESLTMRVYMFSLESCSTRVFGLELIYRGRLK